MTILDETLTGLRACGCNHCVPQRNRTTRASVLNAHVRRHHQHDGSSGHLWQGRFKAFPVQEGDHLLTVLRCVERNPVRAE